MKILPAWLREFVDLKVDLTSEVGARRLADDLTHAGISVESLQFAGENTVFEMEITTNRVDAMNHYGVARECAAIYDLELKPLQAGLRSSQAGPPAPTPAFQIEIHAAEHCADGDELCIERVGHEARDRRLPGSGRPPQDAAVRLARLERDAQRHALAEQVLLPDHVAQRLGPQAFGERGMGSGLAGHGRSLGAPCAATGGRRRRLAAA